MQAVTTAESNFIEHASEYAKAIWRARCAGDYRRFDAIEARFLNAADDLLKSRKGGKR